MVHLTEAQSNLIKSIARQEGFGDFELLTDVGSTKGDNYLGVITTVTVKNGEKKLELILKSVSPSEKLREQVPVRPAFLKEIYLYETILGEFDRFQKEQGLQNGFSAYPRLYGTCDKEFNECLILENLKDAGYKMCSRRVTMDSNHVAMVFAEYGKFHAVSLAMKEKRPDLYRKLTENLRKNIFENRSPEDEEAVWIRSVMKNGFKAVKGNRPATVALERYALVALKFLREDMKVPEDKIVILHGDGWTNNLMFKYEDPQDNKKPTELRILDWQISATGSPVMDLAYFFFVCSPKEVLLDYRKYLKIYHDSVCRSLKGLSCDPETVFPFSLLEYHWKKYAKYGLYIALMLIKLMLGDVEEVPDMTEIAESGKSFADGFNFDSVHNNDYNQRILDIVTMMAENNLI